MARGESAITLPLQGGLGNQLFELAAGIALEARHGRPVRYSDHWLRHPTDEETPRALALDGLLRRDELVPTPVPRVGQLLDRLTGHHVIERSADDDTLARVDRRTRVVAGYFQRLSYVEEAWPALRERFATSSDPAHRRLVTPTTGSYGAVHYRLGDYVSNPGANRHHGLTSPDYFAAVIREAHRSRGITQWRVVSDDTEAAAGLLASSDLPAGVELVPTVTDGDWDDLSVLASARVCAISNSSFSWWAAFVGSATGTEHVVAPRPWFSDGSIAEPVVFPATWERLDRTLL